MFNRGYSQSCFRICLTDCRIFATIKTLVILLVTDVRSNTKITFSNSMLTIKISGLTQYVVLKSQILLK